MCKQLPEAEDICLTSYLDVSDVKGAVKYLKTVGFKQISCMSYDDVYKAIRPTCCGYRNEVLTIDRYGEVSIFNQDVLGYSLYTAHCVYAYSLFCELTKKLEKRKRV